MKTLVLLRWEGSLYQDPVSAICLHKIALLPSYNYTSDIFKTQLFWVVIFFCITTPELTFEIACIVKVWNYMDLKQKIKLATLCLIFFCSEECINFGQWGPLWVLELFGGNFFLKVGSIYWNSVCVLNMVHFDMIWHDFTSIIKVIMKYWFQITYSKKKPIIRLPSDLKGTSAKVIATGNGGL